MRTPAALHVLIAATASVSTVVAVPGSVRAAAVPVVFVVNSAADTADAGPNGVCQTAAAGQCTLRAALAEAQIAAGPVTVRFDIPGPGVQRINVSRQLPVINNDAAPVTIDGFTQPGSRANTDPLVDNAVRNIELVGTVPVTTAPSGVEGLIILSRKNVVRGLVMHGFLRAVRMTGTGAVGNQLVGNIFGLKPNGDFDDAYKSVVGAPCIDVNNGASSNRIGMTGVADRNVISGCFEKGVTFYNQFTYGNVVQNNIIGMDPTGLKRRGNKSMGIDINWSTNWTLIGGTGVRERNLISGNQNSGVEISHGTGTVNNMVVGNFIGSDPTGTNASVASKNLDVGVRLEGAPDCGARPCPPDASRQTVSDNVIVNSGWGGILVDKGIRDSVIRNNRIGITTSGKIASNAGFAIAIHAGATRITVGPGNTIAGQQPGITMSPYGADPVSEVPTVTQHNTFTRNSIITTSGLGIDFLPRSTVNQNGNGDANLNERIDVPVLYVQAAQVVATTCSGCTVELFATTAPTGTFGPGNSYLTSAVATGDGLATFAIPAGGWPPRITATATTPGGSTSEFAANADSAVASMPGAPGSPVATPVPPITPPAPPPAPPSSSVQIDAIVDGAEAGVPAVRVDFSPAAPNGSAITSYTATAEDLTSAAGGGQTASATAGPITVSGLSEGHRYRFTVNATNAIGVGPASVPSNIVTAGGTAATSLLPRALGQRASWRSVRVTGIGFSPGVKLAFSGSGVTVQSVAVNSAAMLTVMVSIAAGAPVGGRDVVVTTAGGLSSTCAQCFTVNAAPSITSVTPGTIAQGQTDLVIDVEGTGFGTGVRVLPPTAGLVVTSLTRLDAAHLRITLSASTSVDVGAHALKVVNTDAGWSSAADVVLVTAVVEDATTEDPPELVTDLEPA